MDFRLSLLQHILCEAPGDNLPALAVQGLEEGFDTPALRQLAGLYGQQHYDPVAVQDLLRAVQAETDIKTDDREAIARELVVAYLDRIIEGDIDPHTGAREIIWGIYHRMPWSDRSRQYVGDSVGLEKLYGLSDGCDDLVNADRPWHADKTNEELLREIKDQIVEEAKRLRPKWNG